MGLSRLAEGGLRDASPNKHGCRRVPGPGFPARLGGSLVAAWWQLKPHQPELLLKFFVMGPAPRQPSQGFQSNLEIPSSLSSTPIPFLQTAHSPFLSPILPGRPGCCSLSATARPGAPLPPVFCFLLRLPTPISHDPGPPCRSRNTSLPHISLSHHPPLLDTPWLLSRKLSKSRC